MKESKHVKLFFKDEKPTTYANCVAPPLELEKALPIIQEIYNNLTDKGLCYMHCWTITHIVMNELGDKRDELEL